MNHVITLSRELGSGGNQVAQELFKRLDIPYYDNEIISKTAEHSGLPQEHLNKRDEKKPNSFLYSIANARLAGAGNPTLALNDIIYDDNAFLYTSETIKRLAATPCIIVGRCGDYILRNKPIIKIFVCAEIEDRIKRISESMELSEKNALKLIQKTDKRRAAYYNSYTDRNWGKASNYHITINTSLIGIEKSVDVLEKFVLSYSEK